MSNHKKLIVLCLSLVFCFAGTKVFAASADVQNFSFKIYQGQYTYSNTISYKYYAGTSKFDRSAYVINPNTSNINFYHYLTDRSKNTKSGMNMSHGSKREPFKNYAPKDTGFGSYFKGSRESLWDGEYLITGSWSADDRTQ
jgi:hypothetical protein